MQILLVILVLFIIGFFIIKSKKKKSVVNKSSAPIQNAGGSYKPESDSNSNNEIQNLEQ
jgi:cell division protein FtsN